MALRLFERATPLALKSLVAASVPAAALKVESVGPAGLVLALPAAGAPTAPEVAKLDAERARLPHEREHLVSLRPAANGRPAALALWLKATPPFGAAEGIVVGRIPKVESLVDCCDKASTPEAVRVLSFGAA